MEHDTDRYSVPIDELSDAYAYSRLVRNSDDEPIDFIVLCVNRAFEKLTGLSGEHVLGKKATEIIPKLFDDDFDWLDLFSRVADGGGSVNVTRYLRPLKRWFSVAAYSDQPGCFAVIFFDLSKIKKVEEALVRSEQKYRSITENCFDAIGLLDLSGSYLYCSPVYEKLLGYKPLELIGKNSFDIIHPDDRKKALATLQQSLEEGIKSNNLVLRLLAKDGSIKIFEHNLRLLKNEDGEFLQILVIGTDITERVHTEEALKRSEQLYKTLVDNANEAIVVVQGSYLEFVNPKAVEIIGYSEEELKRISFIRHIHPDDQDDAMDNFRRFMRGNGPQNRFPVRVYTEKGELRWLEFSGVVIPWDGEDALLGFINDITDRRSAEEDISLKSLVLDQIKDHVTITDLKGIITYVNQTQIETFGRVQQEMVGQPTELFGEDPECGATQREITERTLQDGSWRGEIVNFARDGRRIILDCRTQVINDLDGNPIALCGISTDITERKKSEDKLRYLSFHDSLTGLYNRLYLDLEMKRLDHECKLPVSVIMVDLNGLKLVNDTYGSAVGDKMLKKAADIIVSACSGGEIIARWGGDEFVILMPQTDLELAGLISRKITRNSSEALVEGLPVSLALGISCKDSRKKLLFEMLKEAEDSMNKQKLTENLSARSAVLAALLKALAAKSYETEAHTRRMQIAARAIGQKLGLPESELNRLTLLITLHDIGKINIPEEILTKRGALSPDEWIEIKKHPETGYRIARATEDFAHVAKEILAHHERWDGSGYPQGLKGNDIPFLARIVAIADAYEVMSNGRPYKKAMPREEVIAEFQKCAGTHFDPQLTEIFLASLKN